MVEPSGGGRIKSSLNPTYFPAKQQGPMSTRAECVYLRITLPESPDNDPVAASTRSGSVGAALTSRGCHGHYAAP